MRSYQPLIILIVFVAAVCVIFPSAQRLDLPQKPTPPTPGGLGPSALTGVGSLELAVTETKLRTPQVVAIRSSDDEPAMGKMTLALGDQLKIAFFEKLEPWGELAGRNAGSVSLVEQSTLTGNYVVERTGEVVLPILGAVEAADLTINKLIGELKRAYAAAFHQDARVSVVISDRSPIYVLGAGSRSGTFKFAPGMTVLHALALAGSADDEQHDVYLQSEAVRQKERNETARRRLARVLAQAIALRPEPDPMARKRRARLVELVGQAKGDAVVTIEANARALLNQVKQAQLDAARGAVATAERDIQALNKKLAILDNQIRLKGQRKQAVDRLREVQSANPFIASQVANELFEAEERRLEAFLAMSQAERRSAEAETELKRMTSLQQLELEKEAVGFTQQMDDEESTVASSQQFIDALRLQAARRTVAKAAHLEIVRQTRTGPKQFAAEPMTELNAGDLIHVSANPS